MDYNKKIETLRKRNMQLQQELDTNQIAANTAKDVMNNLQNLEKEWNKELDILKNQRAEYSVLISDLKNMKKELLKKK